jgi:hypothetical protein
MTTTSGWDNIFVLIIQLYQSVDKSVVLITVLFVDICRRDKIAAEREYKKKKAQKKAQRQKQLEEERESEKNKWLDFNAKVLYGQYAMIVNLARVHYFQDHRNRNGVTAVFIHCNLMNCVESIMINFSKHYNIFLEHYD